MYKYTVTIIRPDNTVMWYEKDSEATEYMKTTYYDTGILTVRKLSEDDTVIVKEIEFSDLNAFLSFMDDPIIQEFLSVRRQYESEHGIFRFKQETN